MGKSRAAIGTRAWVSLALCLALGLSARAVTAQAEEIPRGVAVARVECKAEPHQSYALYLPSSYDPAKKWPTLFAFEPMARGTIPVGLFQEAAEKYGYIIIASNNSRNGPVAVSPEAMSAIWTDSRRRFSIDATRVYSTGFSGGARIATRFGLSLPGRVRGVIPMGAGLPLDVQVASPPSFAVYAVVGNRDFNYGEMRRLDERLAAWGLPHVLEVTEQEHAWPPKEVCTRAIEWMELQAIKSGTRHQDQALLNALFAARVGRARELESAGKLAQAYAFDESTLADFRGLHDISEVEAHVNAIRKSADIAKLLKREKEREEMRERLDRDFQGKFAAVHSNIAASNIESAALHLSIAELDISSLRRDSENTKDEDRSIVAQRQLQRVMVGGFEDAALYLQQKDYARAVASLELAALARPESAGIQFYLARAQALNQEKAKALKTLVKAVDLGFANADQIEKEPAFDSLRGDPLYAESLAKIRARPAR